MSDIHQTQAQSIEHEYCDTCDRITKQTLKYKRVSVNKKSVGSTVWTCTVCGSED